MYCYKCGKQIPNGNLCNECAAAAGMYNNPINQTPNQTNYTNPTDKMLGFGPALTATILGSIGFIFSYLGFLFSIWNIGSTIIFTIFSIPLIIIALILGIASIKVFSSRKNLRPKPVATLVLGIVGVASSAIATIFSFFGLIASMTLARF